MDIVVESRRGAIGIRRSATLCAIKSLISSESGQSKQSPSNIGLTARNSTAGVIMPDSHKLFRFWPEPDDDERRRRNSTRDCRGIVSGLPRLKGWKSSIPATIR